MPTLTQLIPDWSEFIDRLMVLALLAQDPLTGDIRYVLTTLNSLAALTPAETEALTPAATAAIRRVGALLRGILATPDLSTLVQLNEGSIAPRMRLLVSECDAMLIEL